MKTFIRTLIVISYGLSVIMALGWVILLLGLLGTAIIDTPGDQGLLYLSAFVVVVFLSPFFFQWLRAVHRRLHTLSVKYA